MQLAWLMLEEISICFRQTLAVPSFMDYTCIHAQSHSHVQLLLRTDQSPPVSSVHGISQQKHQSGLPFHPPGDLPGPGIEPISPASPALAGRFFTSEPPGKPVMEYKGSGERITTVKLIPSRVPLIPFSFKIFIPQSVYFLTTEQKKKKGKKKEKKSQSLAFLNFHFSKWPIPPGKNSEKLHFPQISQNSLQWVRRTKQPDFKV